MKQIGITGKLGRLVSAVCQQEGLPVGWAMVTYFTSSCVRICLYRCLRDCPPYFYIGDQTVTLCPTCGFAVYEIESCSSEYPSNPEFRKQVALKAHAIYAGESFKSGRLGEAIRSLTRVLELNPRDHDAMHNRAEVLIAMGDFRSSIDDCNRAIQLDPGAAGTYLTRGAAKAFLGDYQGGVDDTTKALSLGSYSPIAYFNRGMCLIETGCTNRAIADLRRFLCLAPTDERVSAVEKVLNDLSFTSPPPTQ